MTIDFPNNVVALIVVLAIAESICVWPILSRGLSQAASSGARTWRLGMAVAFKLLLAPDSNLELLSISDPEANLRQANAELASARRTPQGHARIALVSAGLRWPLWRVSCCGLRECSPRG